MDCPRNCTSSDNGVCQTNGKCFCNNGFEGDDCSTHTIISKEIEFMKINNSNAPFNILKEINFNEINSRYLNSDINDQKKSQTNFSENITNTFTSEVNENNKDNKNIVKNEYHNLDKITNKDQKCSNYGIYDESSKKCVCDVKKIK